MQKCDSSSVYHAYHIALVSYFSQQALYEVQDKRNSSPKYFGIYVSREKKVTDGLFRFSSLARIASVLYLQTRPFVHKLGKVMIKCRNV